MDVVEIYRRAFEIFKGNYLIAAPFIAVNIIIALLFMLLAGGLLMAGEGAPPLGPSIGMPGLGTVLGAALVVTLLSWVLNILAQGMVAGMSSAVVSRGVTSLEDGFDVLARKLGGLIVAGVLVSMAVGVGLVLLIIPGLVAGFLLMFTVIALVVEGLGVAAAMKRSYRVVRSNLGDAFVYAVLMVAIWIIAGIIGAVLSKVPVVGYSLLSPAVDGMASTIITIAGVLFLREATT